MTTLQRSLRLPWAARATVCLWVASIGSLAGSPPLAVADPAGMTVSIATSIWGGRATVGGRLQVEVSIENRGELPLRLVADEMLSVEALCSVDGRPMGGSAPHRGPLRFDDLEVLQPSSSVRRNFSVPLRMEGQCVIVARLANADSRALKGSVLADCPDLWKGVAEARATVRVDEFDMGRLQEGSYGVGWPGEDLVERLSRLGASVWGLDASEASLARVVRASRQAVTSAERQMAFTSACAAVSRAWGGRSASFVLAERPEALAREQRLAQLAVAGRVKTGSALWSERLGPRLTARYGFTFAKETIEVADRMIKDALLDPDLSVQEAARSAVR